MSICRNIFRLIPPETLVMEDLIQNVNALFDENPSQLPSIPSSSVVETTSIHTYGSLFLSPELPQSAEVQAMGSTSQERQELADGISASTQSPLSSFPSDDYVERRLAQQPSALLSPLLGLSWSKTLAEGTETTAQEQLIPEARGTEAIRTLPNGTPPDVVPLPAPTSVDEWRLHQSRLPPDTEAQRRPQSPPESVLSNASEFLLSSATSLQTRMWSP
jgi:hypothetical protein